MLTDDSWRYRQTEADEKVFRCLVPSGHPLRKLLGAVDWERFGNLVSRYYCPNFGKPAINPLIILKLEFLRYLYGLRDRGIMERAQTDVAIRYFLGVGMIFQMPDPSILCRFRGRLGVDGFHSVFQDLVAQAREAGVVGDRLRLKDASHVLANIAVPTILGLVAQVRDRLISTAAPFDPQAAEGHRVNVELIRERTQDLEAAERLQARIEHVQDILDWVEQIPAPENAGQSRRWKRLQEVRQVAAKILYEQAHPEAKHRTVSVVDPDARRGKHGQWYEGYSLDILMDADSEFITELNVLAAGGNEAQDAIELVRREEAAHGNDIEELSMDGIGFNGAMLQELEDPDGLAVEVFVPPTKEQESGSRFQSNDFQLTDDGNAVTCPAGQTSTYRQQEKDHTTIHRFTRKQCDACSLVQQCMANPGKGKFGKVVRKNQYEPVYQRARQRALTEKYARVRKEHPAIERKLNEVLNHHRGRYARYWGDAKVLCQQYMTCLTVNLKRLVVLLRAKSLATA